MKRRGAKGPVGREGMLLSPSWWLSGGCSEVLPDLVPQGFLLDWLKDSPATALTVVVFSPLPSSLIPPHQRYKSHSRFCHGPGWAPLGPAHQSAGASRTCPRSPGPGGRHGRHPGKQRSRFVRLNLKPLLASPILGERAFNSSSSLCSDTKWGFPPPSGKCLLQTPPQDISPLQDFSSKR